ncbi:GyrI-like domain-containing protein [Streptomyces sp. NBC_01429]|uniref:GyrI-like domain-containing protein n=1 Tax=Streptomyces sp. NBC_01429 TaxID=2903862 RepID=UPI003FCEA57B
MRSILDERVGSGELRGMPRLRRTDLAAAMAADAVRLAQVEARLRTIESEGLMSSSDVVVKRIAPVRVAELTGTAMPFAPEGIGPVIGPLYDELDRRLSAAGVAATGPGVAYYEVSPDAEDTAIVHAGMTIAAEPRAGLDFAVVDLPEIENAATIVHRGSVDEIMSSLQALARWIEANGYRSTGHARELYLECPDDRDQWVTELQEPVTRA